MVQIITTNGGGGGGVGVYKYKGSVNSYNDLPSSGMKIGDVYNVVNAHTTNPKFPAGSNLAWTGTEWDVLGGNIDLSDYQKKLIEGEGIDINSTTNEISVESSVVSGAAAGATAVQPGDLCAVATSGKYCDLTGTPSLCTVATSGKYCDLSGTPTIPTDNCQLANGCGYTTCTGTLSTCSDVISALGYTPYSSANPSGYTTCTGTLVASDLTPYAKSCTLCTVATSGKYCDLSGTPALCTVATSGKYCDLTGTPTIGNAKLTIQKNGTDVNSITMNATSNVTANISVPTDTSDLTNNAGFLTSSDLSGYQTTSCMVCNLSGADNSHYPSAKAVADALQCAGAGDMLASVYDPCNKQANAFDYCNFINTPTIPTDNCQLANGCGYTTCTGTVVASDLNAYATTASLCTVATSGKYCDLTGTPTIPAAQIQSDWRQTCNTCKDFIKNKPSLCNVATSGKYCDLSGLPTIPTNNNQLTNGCGYTTCTGTLSSCADIVSALGYTPYSSANPNGYTTCTGTLVASDLTPYAKSCDLKAVATSGKYCDLTGTPTIPTDNCQLANGCGYTTCTGTLSATNTGCNGQVLTKTSSGATWCDPSGGDVKVSTQTCNILTSGMSIWAGCQCDYDNLGTYDNNTVYLTI